MQTSNPVPDTVVVSNAATPVINSPQINIMLATSSSTEDIPPPKPDYYAPPPYEVATQGSKLPTYEEVQREKHLEQQDIPIGSATRVSTIQTELIN